MDASQTNEQAITSWLRQHAIPLRHLDAGHGFTDQHPLTPMLQDVTVVGLGEATHGTHEFFQLKHRLVEFLVTELGFTLFAIEASYAACLPINDYVLNGTGDRATVLAGQPYLAWDTEEFSALVDWFREYNRGVPDARKVTFYGVDVTDNDNGRRAVLQYLRRVASDRVEAAEACFRVLAQGEATWPAPLDEELQTAVRASLFALDDLITYLGENRAELARRSSAEELDRVLLFTRIMPQWWADGPDGRSHHMAENLLRLLERERADTKAIYWGHNVHVRVVPSPEGAPSLGQALRDRYGDAYFAFGLEFNQGSYQTRAVDPDGSLVGFQDATIDPAPVRSLPWYLSRAGIDAFLVSLRTPPTNTVVAQWLDTPLNEHGIAWVYGEPSSFYEPVTPRQAYDGLVFVERSTPAHPTATARERAARREGL